MKVLLDTHIWIWSQLEPRRLSRRVTNELSNQDNEHWLSPVSVWELLVLCRKGRIHLDRPPDLWVSESVAFFQEAPLTHEIVLVAEQLQLSQADPADRFLAATAKILDLTLITADQKLLGLGDIATLANR